MRTFRRPVEHSDAPVEMNGESPIVDSAAPSGGDQVDAQPIRTEGQKSQSIDPTKLEAERREHWRQQKRKYRQERRERERENRASVKMRPPAPDSKPVPAANTFSQGGVAKILFSVHYMAASFFHQQALALDEKESEQYAKVIMEFSAAWGHPELSDKALATLNLGGTMIMLYGPRLVVIARRQRQPKLPAAPSPSGNAYNDAARSTQQQAAAPQPKQQAQAVRPNGGFIQTASSPFGDEDGMAI